MLMKLPTALLLALFGGALLAQTTTPPMGIRDHTPRHQAFINAHIVVSPDRVIDDGVLIIKNGYIEAIGDNIHVPDDAEVIDLKGKSVYPGFIDPFTDYGVATSGEANPQQRGFNQPPIYTGDRTGARTWNDALHPEADWVAKFHPNKEQAAEFEKIGFTLVQSASRDGILRGRSFVALLGDDLPNNLVVKGYANEYASFDKGSSKQQYPSSLMGSIALLRQTFLDVQWYRAARDAYRRNPSQRMPEFNRGIAALEDYQAMRFIFETKDELSLLRADRIAKEFGLDMVHVGSNYEYRRLSEIAATGRTLILPLAFHGKPAVKTVEDELDVTLADLRHWERAPSNAAALEQAGIRFAFTTYRLKKKSDFLKKVRLTIQRGLSKKTALAALTEVPAEICGVRDMAGSLETGKLANFFVCDGDPLEEKVTIFSTWSAGRKKEFLPLDQTDFRGEYRVTLLGETLSLSLKGSLGSPSGSLEKDSVSVKLKDVSVTTDRLFFSATLDTFNIKGLSRFSARLIHDTLQGTWDNPDAGQNAWEAVRTAPFTEKPDTSQAVKKPFTFVSRLTHPDRAFGVESVPVQEDVLITHATIWTCDDNGILNDADMLIRNGKIAQVGQNLQIPKGVRVIDASGKQVTPGLIDEHSHTAISDGVNEGTHAVTSEVRIADVINPDDINIYRALAGGTTVLQSLHGSANPIGGQVQVIKLRWGMSSEELKFVQAPPTIKFALGENVKQSNWGDNFRSRYPQSRMGVETIMEDAFNAALDNERAWQEYEKLGRSEKRRTIPPRHDLQLEALQEVLHSRMFVHCHSYHQTEMLMLMRLAEQYGFHIQNFTHVLEGYKVAAEMAAHGATASSFSDWWAYKFEVYDAIPYNTCIMQEKGVITSVNSDSPELGRRLNQEAAKSVMYCGMSQEDALKLVTINPAIQLLIDKYVGSLTVGKDADFVIWNGNPLSVYSHPLQTWVDGRLFFDIDRDATEREKITQERSDLIQKVLTSRDEDGKPATKQFSRPDQVWHCEDVVDIWQTGRREKGDNHDAR